MERFEHVAKVAEEIVTPANGFAAAPAPVVGVTDTAPLQVAGGEPVMLVQLCISFPPGSGEL